MNLNCERNRELMALALYDELEPDEKGRVTAHNQTCEACTEFERTLELGLGELLDTSAQEPDLPGGWRESLRDAVRHSPGPRVPRWMIAAASFAAGVLLSASVRGPVAELPVIAELSRVDGPAWSESSSPPPHANTRGPLAQAGSYLEAASDR